MVALGMFLASVRAENDGAILAEAAIAEQPLGPTALFGKNLEIRAENGIKFLSKLDSESQLIVDDRKGINWIDYIYTVRYREPEKSTATFVVKARGLRPEAPYLWYYVMVTPGGISMMCHGIPKDRLVEDPRLGGKVTYGELGAANFAPGEWVTVEISVGDEVIKVSVIAADEQVRKTEFKVLPGTGGVAIGARAPMDVASAVVRDAGGAVMPSN